MKRLIFIGVGLLSACSSSNFTTAEPIDAATDSTAADSTEPRDTAAGDTATGDTATTADTAVVDSSNSDGKADTGPKCEGHTSGPCPEGLSCVSCPAGGPSNNYVCSTPCTSNAQCTDPARPKCNMPLGAEEGICTANEFACLWGAVSTRKLKDEIAYLSDEEIVALARQALTIKLASYHYKSDKTGKKNLGYILEDAPNAASSDLSKNQVDLYAYASMVLAATKVQEKRIDALEKEMTKLRAQCSK